jgi:hypothetical protein
VKQRHEFTTTVHSIDGIEEDGRKKIHFKEALRSCENQMRKHRGMASDRKFLEGSLREFKSRACRWGMPTFYGRAKPPDVKSSFLACFTSKEETLDVFIIQFCIHRYDLDHDLDHNRDGDRRGSREITRPLPVETKELEASCLSSAMVGVAKFR